MAAITALMAAATLALLPALESTPPAGPIRLTLWMVVALSAATELAPVYHHRGRQTHTLSLSEITLVIGLAFAAPGDLVLGRAIAGLAVYGGYRRLPVLKTGFNTVLFALETAAAAVVFRAVLGGGSPAEPIGWLAAVLAIGAATAIGIGAVRGILALHGERTATRDTRATTMLSLGLTALGTVIGILAVGAIWLHGAAMVTAGIAAAGLFAGIRLATDQAIALQHRGALEDAIGLQAAPVVLATIALETLCLLLHVEHAEATVPDGGSLRRIHVREGRPTDHAEVSLARRTLLFASIDQEAPLWGRRLPRPIRLELVSRGFRNPVVVALANGRGPVGYLAIGTKRAPERRPSRTDRRTLELAARHLERACRETALT
ncbi:MAG: hypothetical protein KJ956_11055 [Actinobacteria bacterium]|nr:hypothetical protein [Actinomycetota bacterium]